MNLLLLQRSSDRMLLWHQVVSIFDGTRHYHLGGYTIGLCIFRHRVLLIFFVGSLSKLTRILVLVLFQLRSYVSSLSGFSTAAQSTTIIDIDNGSRDLVV